MTGWVRWTGHWTAHLEPQTTMLTVGLGCGLVQMEMEMEGADCRQILLDAASGLESAGKQEPRGIQGEMVARDGEGCNASHSAVGFEGIVLRGRGPLGGARPCVHHQSLHFPFEVSQWTFNKTKGYKQTFQEEYGTAWDHRCPAWRSGWRRFCNTWCLPKDLVVWGECCGGWRKT